MEARVGAVGDVRSRATFVRGEGVHLAELARLRFAGLNVRDGGVTDGGSYAMGTRFCLVGEEGDGVGGEYFKMSGADCIPLSPSLPFPFPLKEDLYGLMLESGTSKHP